MTKVIKTSSIDLSDRLLCDLELLLNGSFAPLTGFLNEDDYVDVVYNMRLAPHNGGALWPMPIVLPVSGEQASSCSLGDVLDLKDKYGTIIARLAIESVYVPNIMQECKVVYGTVDDNHPYVNIVLNEFPANVHYIGGSVVRVADPLWLDFQSLRLSPDDTNALFSSFGELKHVLAFQTRNPMHRCHMELTKNALSRIEGGAHLFIQPIVGVTQECDVDYVARIKCYQHILKYYPAGSVTLGILPLSMRMAGPREALWHALIRRNYGATHFVIGRDHAGPSSKTKSGNSFYGPYEAQELVASVSEEMGIDILTSSMIMYDRVSEAYVTEVESGMDIATISGTEFRRRLRSGEDIPSWFSYPEVIDELRRTVTSKGVCVYFVGLSASGKSTLAVALKQLCQEHTSRPITILDGDVVRRNLSKGLGFSREDRSTNVRRIGYVASEIVQHGGIVFCANIAPYAEDRAYNRSIIEGAGGAYVEVYVQTPLSVCEERDPKGLYKLARDGTLPQFTGISDPFEEPESPDIAISAAEISPLDGARAVFAELSKLSLL